MRTDILPPRLHAPPIWFPAIIPLITIGFAYGAGVAYANLQGWDQRTGDALGQSLAWVAGCGTIPTFAMLHYGLLMVIGEIEKKRLDIIRHDPDALLPDDYQELPQDKPPFEYRTILYDDPSNSSAWWFEVSPAQWKFIAKRIKNGFENVPINELSGDGTPFKPKEIMRVRQRLVEAGLAYYQPGDGQVILKSSGKAMIARAATSPL